MVSFVSESDTTRPGCTSVMECTCIVVVAVAVFDGKLVPTTLIADTRYVYIVFGVRPVSEYVVAVEPVSDDIIFQVVPLSGDLSILYPVIGEPPLSVGADQERLI